MKISYSGITLPEGKVKFNEPNFTGLVEKFKPAKVSPFYFEFLDGDHESADAIVLGEESILDVILVDIEKVEARLSRMDGAGEAAVLERCRAHLEAERLLCDMELNENEISVVRALGLLSFKPTVSVDDASPDADSVCRAVMEKAGMMFFYTVGKKEVHAWLVEKGADAVTCAGKIHSDLARGFIKAEIVSCENMMSAHSLQDARSKGLTELLDREDVVPAASIMDVRFNV